MALTDLTELEILQGIFTLIFVLISIVLGLIILLKYFSIKRKELIFVGAAWIFLSSGWWGSAFSFLSIILLNYMFSPFLYLFVGNVFIPVAVLCWIYAIGRLIYTKSKNKILALFLAICIPYEIIIVVLLIINPSLVGTMKGTFYSQPALFAMIFQIFALLVTIITGFTFSIRSMKSKEPEIKWKGRFLLFGFISFTIGAFIDALITLDPITLVVVRLLLIASSILYFFGFLLPDRIAKLLISKTA
jgi:hypothetical protein